MSLKQMERLQAYFQYREDLGLGDDVEDSLLDLARRAVATPALDAPLTFAVLFDAVIAQGIIKDARPGTFTLEEQVMAWARVKAGKPLAQQVQDAFADLSEGLTIDVATGAALDRMAALYGLQRREPVAAGPYRTGASEIEDDASLRSRMQASLSAVLPRPIPLPALPKFPPISLPSLPSVGLPLLVEDFIAEVRAGWRDQGR